MKQSAEVLVLGGGPGGATTAGLLARWGHDVLLCTRSVTPAGELAESIPPSARRLLLEAGTLDAVEGAAFHPNRGNVVWWAGAAERFEAERAGYHVDRARLESVLLGAAQAAGARVLRGAWARAATALATGCRVSVALDPDGPPTHASLPDEVHARWLVDATGRMGLVARTEGRIDDPIGTIALVGRWRRDDAATEKARGCTLVESYRDGWAWSVPLAETERVVTMMVDPRLTDLDRRGGAAPMYEAELAKTERVRDFLEGWKLVSDAWACPSSPYSAPVYAREGLLLVGDAGSFIDPLFSYGVKKALASAWLAAVAIHTALTEPALTQEAVAFHDRRERSVYRSYRRLSAPFFREAWEAYGTDYWRRRFDIAVSAGGGTTASGDPEELPARDLLIGLPDEAVRAALDEIHSRDELVVRRGASASEVSRPRVEGNRIVLAPKLATDAVPGGGSARPRDRPAPPDGPGAGPPRRTGAVGGLSASCAAGAAAGLSLRPRGGCSERHPGVGGHY